MTSKGFSTTFDLGAFEKSTERAAIVAMTKTALFGEALVKAKLSEPGRGKEYSRGKTAKHIASAPGQPPAPDTGRMRAATTHEVIVSGLRVIARVTVNVDYALGLELGTERIAPRPFIRPTTPVLFEVAGDELRKAF